MPSRTLVARTPLPVATTALATSGLVLVAAALWPTSPALPFLGRVAGFGLAGCAAYLLDDAADPLTSVAPQGPWRRRASSLATGALMIASAWLAVLLVLDWRDVRPPVPEASLEVLVLGLVAFAAAALLFRLGDHEPGTVVAPAAALVGLALVIVEGVVHTSVFLTSAATPGRTVTWLVVGIGALLGAVAALRDASTRRPVPDVTPWRKRRSGVS